MKTNIASYFLLLSFLGFLSFPVIAQQTVAFKEELPFPGQLMKREPIGNYLAPLTALKKREVEYSASEQWRGFFFDMMAYANSYVGNYAEAIAYFDKGQKKNKPEEIKISDLKNYNPKNALDVISALSAKEQVIMLNELHHVPMHRAFTARLLPILYQKGFRYLAVEAVNEIDSELNSRGYPVYKTGGYTSEPVFGDMLRVALKLGFKIVPYEYSGKCQPKQENPYYCQNERERGQAQNIYDRILREHPGAKILVHAGAGHIQEYRSAQVTIMAAHFKDISHIDPFTIDQIEMNEHSAPEYEEADYRYVTGKNLIKVPTIFQSVKGDYRKNINGQFSTVDAQVFHPRVKYKNNRPEWLRVGKIRKPFVVKSSFWARKQSNPNEANYFLIQAFAANEVEGAVPVDQVVVSDSMQKAVLMLPSGRFRLRLSNEAGKIINEAQISR